MIDFITSFVSEYLGFLTHSFSERDYAGLFLGIAGGILFTLLVSLIIYGIFVLLFRRNFYSEEKITTGKVVKTSFVPEHGGTHVVPVFSANGMGTAITDDHEDEKDIVVFKTKDVGRMEINNAELLESVEKGDSVDITYRDKYTFWVWDESKKTFDNYVPTKVKTKDGEEIEV